MVIAGGVVSILIGPTLVLLLLPARFMQTPETVTPDCRVFAVKVFPPVG